MALVLKPYSFGDESPCRVAQRFLQEGLNQFSRQRSGLKVALCHFLNNICHIVYSAFVINKLLIFCIFVLVSYHDLGFILGRSVLRFSGPKEPRQEVARLTSLERKLQKNQESIDFLTFW